MTNHAIALRPGIAGNPVTFRNVTAALAVMLALSCGGDLVFPEVDAALLAANCVRGSLEPPTTTAGDLTTAECVTGIGEPFETWRIRVSETSAVRFEISFGFDDPAGTYALTLTEYLDFPRTLEIGDEFTSIGQTNSPTSETWTLQPGTREYWLRVRLLVGEGPYQVTLTPIDGA